MPTLVITLPTSLTTDLVALAAPITGVPAAPSGLVALSPTPTSVSLTWTDNATNETGYKVLRRQGSNPFAVLSGATALPAGTTSYTDNLVAAGTTYDYQVVAFNGVGDSPISNTASVTTSPQPSPEPPPAPDPTVTPNLLQVGAPLYQWIDASGDSHPLSDTDTALADVAVLAGWRGLLMPEVALTETETPFLDGSRITGVRVPAREVDLPLFVRASDEMGLRTTLRTMVKWFDPHRGDGILRVTAPDGSQRDLSCRYAGGLSAASDALEQAGQDWWTVIVTLRAADPYFYATAPTTRLFTTAAPVAFFPLFPLRLSESSVISTASMDNTGDVEAWPIWTISGPATAVTLTNATTGDSLSATLTLAAGAVLTIDTRPGRKSVTLTSGGGSSNVLNAVSPTSSLWPLAVGMNDLDIALSGSSSASSVQLSYTPRFLSF